jgi:hypothetical protein
MFTRLSNTSQTLHQHYRQMVPHIMEVRAARATSYDGAHYVLQYICSAHSLNTCLKLCEHACKHAPAMTTKLLATCMYTLKTIIPIIAARTWRPGFHQHLSLTRCSIASTRRCRS